MTHYSRPPPLEINTPNLIYANVYLLLGRGAGSIRLDFGKTIRDIGSLCNQLGGKIFKYPKGQPSKHEVEGTSGQVAQSGHRVRLYSLYKILRPQKEDIIFLYIG